MLRHGAGMCSTECHYLDIVSKVLIWKAHVKHKLSSPWSRCWSLLLSHCNSLFSERLQHHVSLLCMEAECCIIKEAHKLNSHLHNADRRIVDCRSFLKIIKLIQSHRRHLEAERKTVAVEQVCFEDLTTASGLSGQTHGPCPSRTHLRVFPSQVSVHGCSGGHLCPAEVTRLGLHLLMGQVHMFLQHVLGQVLLITGRTRPRLPHCREREGQ